jgi:hypothetical protein
MKNDIANVMDVVIFNINIKRTSLQDSFAVKTKKKKKMKDTCFKKFKKKGKSCCKSYPLSWG